MNSGLDVTAGPGRTYRPSTAQATDPSRSSSCSSCVRAGRPEFGLVPGAAGPVRGPRRGDGPGQRGVEGDDSASQRSHHLRVTVRALAGHARVSATFLYGNPAARALLASARDAAGSRATARSAATTARAEASWRERALNAEDALSHAHTEILTQRRRIGELAGTIRDLETPLSTGSAQRLTAENTTLHHRIRQLTDEHRTLRERLDAARSASRFLDRRVADLEAQIAEHIVQAT